MEFEPTNLPPPTMVWRGSALDRLATWAIALNFQKKAQPHLQKIRILSAFAKRHNYENQVSIKLFWDQLHVTPLNDPTFITFSMSSLHAATDIIMFVIVKNQNNALPCFDPGYAEIVKDVLQAIPSVFLIAK